MSLLQKLTMENTERTKFLLYLINSLCALRTLW